jgi:hypothetical protein
MLQPIDALPGVERRGVDPSTLCVRVAMLQRAVLREEQQALATGRTAEGLFHTASLLDDLVAEQTAAWLNLAPALELPPDSAKVSAPSSASPASSLSAAGSR